MATTHFLQKSVPYSVQFIKTCHGCYVDNWRGLWRCTTSVVERLGCESSPRDWEGLHIKGARDWGHGDGDMGTGTWGQ